MKLFKILAFKLYGLLLEKIRNRASEQEKLEKENKKKRLDFERLKQLNKISSGLLYDVDKFSFPNYLEKKIQFLQSSAPVTISSYNFGYIKSEKEKKNFPSSSIIKMIDNVILYNDLLSQDYQKFINNTKDLNFNNCNKDNFDKLERYNRNLVIDKKQVLERKKKTSKQNIEQNFSNSQNISLNNNYYKMLTPINSQKSIRNYNKKKSDVYFLKKKKNINEKSEKLEKSSNSISTKELSSRRLNISKGTYQFEKLEKSESTKNKNTILNSKKKNKIIKYYSPKQIERYPLSQSFIFNKTFKRKIEYLEKMNNREIKFQKNILYLKKVESRILKDVEKENDYTVKGINKANFSFNLIKEKIYKKFKKAKLLFVPSSQNKVDEIDKLNFQKSKLQENLIAGLNPKKLELLKVLDKNIEIMRNEQFTKLLHTNNYKPKKDGVKEKDVYFEKFEKNIKNVSNINNNIISILDKDINNFKKKEKFLYQLKK